MPLITVPKQSTHAGGLPPVPTGHQPRRLTAIRRSHTTNLDSILSNTEDRFSLNQANHAFHHQRPLRNIQVASRTTPNGSVLNDPKTGSLASLRNGVHSANGLRNGVHSIGALRNGNLLPLRNGTSSPKQGTLGSLRNGTSSSIRSLSSGPHSRNGNVLPLRNGVAPAHLIRSSSVGPPAKNVSSRNGILLNKGLNKYPYQNGMHSPTNSVSNLSTISRSVSPCSSFSVRSSVSPTPRRIFPQVANGFDLSELEQKEQSPVVFDANLTFVIGCKTPVRQQLKPVAAHLDKSTASNLLSAKIADFLKRTDHVMDEWREMGHKDDEDKSWAGYNDISRNAEERRVLGRSRSATNIMLKGFQYFSRASSVSRAGSVMSEDRFTDMTDFDEVCHFIVLNFIIFSVA